MQETQAFFSLKALIVGSNARNRHEMRVLLQALAMHQLCEAEDEAAALRAIRTQRFDLALCDLELAPTGGIAFTRALRLNEDSPNPYLPLILVVDGSDRQTVVTARDAGVTEILAKPIAANALAMRIVEIVERPRAFVRCQGYFGPDRRRRRNESYAGPLRRREDAGGATTAC